MKLSELKFGQWFKMYDDELFFAVGEGRYIDQDFDQCWDIPVDAPITLLPDCTGWDWQPHQPPPLQVEAGKFYQRRDGKAVGPAKRDSGYPTHPWTVDDFTYRDDGTQAEVDGEKRSVDLIREVPPHFTNQTDAFGGKLVSDEVPATKDLWPDDLAWGPKWEFICPKSANELQEGDQFLKPIAHGNAQWMPVGESTWNEATKWDHFCFRRPRAAATTQYRPFANAEEFKPHRDRWILVRHGDIEMRVLSVCRDGINLESFGNTVLEWKRLVEEFTFDDGTPCGVRV